MRPHGENLTSEPSAGMLGHDGVIGGAVEVEELDKVDRHALHELLERAAERQAALPEADRRLGPLAVVRLDPGAADAVRLQPVGTLAARPAGEALDFQIDVGRLLAELAPKQRAVLHLTTIEGYTDREIAEVLGITSSSVRVHRLRARRRLAKLTEKGGRDDRS